jgi:Family of unknown function (DUF5989)
MTQPGTTRTTPTPAGTTPAPASAKRPGTTRTNVSTSRELLSFIWNGKTWWLTPVVVVLIMLSFLVVFLETSALAPFIYALF